MSQKAMSHRMGTKIITRKLGKQLRKKLKEG